MRAERKLHDASEDNPVRAVTASNYFKLACPARPPVVESRGEAASRWGTTLERARAVRLAKRDRPFSLPASE